MSETKVHTSNLFLSLSCIASLGSRKACFKVLAWTGWGRQTYLPQCFILNQIAPVRIAQEDCVQQSSGHSLGIKMGAERFSGLCRALRERGDDMISCPDKTQAARSHQTELAIVSQGNCVSSSAGCRDSEACLVCLCLPLLS